MRWKIATAWPEYRHAIHATIVALLSLTSVNVAECQPESCSQATQFTYFDCENYPPVTTHEATLCYWFITSGSEVDFNYGYFAFCPDLQVEYTLYNILCDSLTTNTSGYFDIAPGVAYIVCGSVACLDSSGLGISQVCTAELLSLPVELVGFVAYPVDAGVVLSWTTASERNSDRFEVFRMRTPMDKGELIASLRAAGYSVGRTEYRATDVSPEAGLRYYRLEGIDRDGVRTYLRLLFVTWEGRQGSLGPFDLLGRRVR